MHHSLWKKTNTLLSPAEKIGMRTANGGVSSTMGCVKNMKISVGRVSGLFQVHIAERLPVGLLLGRPFLTLFSCTAKDYVDGYQELTLTCPNTSKEYVVTTKESIPKGADFR
ncbi:hypothetical protein CALCODRAFT_529531 [Calocera cornea HHB12733]|uniref:Uncharacterized protein n=1 Tax=Calocera cornea HHB12733 TaxID=1353952 RepID=A0A165DP46_9BASI|nr:hypothetical protein CALCODRAFT_529531 [Calocera cornea HHB12733]